MARFTRNITTALGGNSSVLTASPKADALTGNGGAGFSYTDKSALFLLGVTNFTGQDTYYEGAASRDQRYVELIRSVAATDPEWVANFLSWLRSDGNIRTAAIVGAVEYGRAVTGKNVKNSGRKLLAKVLQRADEPSEALGYYLSTYGKPLPSWFKRGLGDAAKKLYTEKSVLKYDSAGAAVRFGDVISLSQVDTKDSPYKSAVFSYAQDRRYNNVDLDHYPVLLKTVVARTGLAEVPQDAREEFLKSNPQIIEAAGYTWESLASWVGGELTAGFWESMIPDMGYMALIRNLRNFAKAGISQSYAKFVAEKISDESAVLSSRQLPLRFLSAYRAIAPSRNHLLYGIGYGNDGRALTVDAKYRRLWEPALGKALDISLGSVPELSGRTIIMVDTSGSMASPVSDKSTVMCYDNAVTFGVALALRAEDSVTYGYQGNATAFEPRFGSSLLDNVSIFQRDLPVGGGTATVRVADELLRKHKDATRLVILTDEQANYGGSLADVVPAKVTTFTFNLAGYGVGHAPSGRGNFYTIGGLTDAAFTMMQSVDQAGSGSWPWESSTER